MRTPETRPTLIVRLQGQRNEPAWREFVAAYEPFLQQLVQRQGVPPRHVPDVTQQVLLAIARSLDGWQDDGGAASFRRWVGRVARNVVIKFMGRERRQAGGIGGSDLLEQLHNVPEITDPAQQQAYEFEVILWAAEKVKNEFRETSWQAFWLTTVEQHSIEAVSQQLGVSPGSVYMSRSRVLARIREIVSRVEN